MAAFYRTLEHLRFRFAPGFARFVTAASTWQARRRLRADGPIAILIDNTVLSHATTHESAWISTGPKQWGNQTIETGYAARIAVHPTNSDNRDYRQIRFLPGLISLAQRGHIRLHTSAELKYEQLLKPSGMFRGYGDYDHNLFAAVELDSIDGFVFPHLGPSWMKLPTAEHQRRTRLAAYAASDPAYASLIEVLGKRNSQDAWHIRTAEKHKLFCFLTMDYRLLDNLESQRGAKRIKALQTKVMSPADLAAYLGLLPVAPHLFSYTNASFPVRPDLAWPDGRRRGRGKKAPGSKTG